MPSSPIRFSAGTSRSSKKSMFVWWLNITSRGSTRSRSPASRRSTMKTESPRVLSSSSSYGVVRASSTMRSDCFTREMKTFWPFTT